MSTRDVQREMGENDSPARVAHLSLALWARVVFFGAAYFGCAVLGNFLVIKPGPFVNFWLPSGLYVATLLLNRKVHWPWFIAAAFLANISFDLANGQRLFVTFLFALGNSLEATCGAMLVRRFTGDRITLTTVREVIILIGCSAILSTCLSATIGASTISHVTPGESFRNVWLLWWSGDALGVLLMAPLFLTFQNRTYWSPQRTKAARFVETLVLVVSLSLAVIYIFRAEWHANFALKYAIIPFVLWSCFRYGQKGNTLLNLWVAILVAWLTAHGYGEIALSGVAPRLQVAALQIFLAMLAVTGLFLAAILAERQRVEERYRFLFLRSLDAVLLSTIDGRILSANPAACALFGGTEAELIQAHRNDLVDNSDGRLTAGLQERSRTGSFRGELNFLRRDSSKFPGEISSAVFSDSNGELRTCLVIRDITERKRAEEALQESEKRFRRLFESAPVPLWEGDFSAVKQRLTQLGGTTGKTIRRMLEADQDLVRHLASLVRVLNFNTLATQFWDLGNQKPLSGNLLDYAEQRLLEFLAGVVVAFTDGSIRFNGEAPIRTPQGGQKELFINLSIAPGCESTWERVYVSFIDITDRKCAEQQLLQSQQQLRSLTVALSQAEQQERERLATVLHDTVLQSMALARMKLSALLASAPSSQVASSAEAIRRLVEETIQSARFQTSQLSPPILHELGLESALDWLAEQFAREHNLPCRFICEGKVMQVDAKVGEVLFRATRELLLNIIKHARATQAEIKMNQEADKLQIVVEDNGIGFDAALIWGPGGKTGAFGLFSLRERLGHLGGECLVKSAPGHGTKVTLVVPIQTENRQH